MDIAGKVALVTGAAVRVGRQTALELAHAGADLLIHYRNSESAAAELVEMIRATGRSATAVQADFTRPAEACDRLLAAVDAAFGRCDILVNNASAYTPGTPGDMPAGQWADLVATNITTPTALAWRLAERMAGRDGGVIVNMLSLQARQPWPRYLACGMTDGAMWTATVGLARKFAPLVRVNGVAPGTVLWNDQDNPALLERIISQTPLKRIGQPSDVAKAVRFLVENDYMTGQVLCVDGGRSIG